MFRTIEVYRGLMEWTKGKSFPRTWEIVMVDVVDSRAVDKVGQNTKSAKAAAGARTPKDKRQLGAEELHQLIAVAAYYLAERRNFEPGHEVEDWLSAEAQIRVNSKA